MHVLGKKQLFERDVNTLKGIIEGIASDGIINEAEMNGMQNWINRLNGDTAQINNHIYRNLILYLQEAISDKILTDDEREEIITQCNAYTFDNPYYTVISRGMQNLTGLLSGIIMDGIINKKELIALNEWQEDNIYLEGLFPYDEIYKMVLDLLNDETFSTEKTQRLFDFATALTNEDETEDNAEIMELLMSENVYAIDPKIIIPGSCFVLTGVSERHSRSEIKKELSDHGGIVKENISLSVDYLIVCANKNIHWAFSSYGRKIEAALKLRKQGKALSIVHEFDLYDLIFD